MGEIDSISFSSHCLESHRKFSATRLKQLEEQGLVKKTVERVSPKAVRWALTEKGIDVVPIGMMLSAFGSKWNADKVFDDKRPRKLHEMYNDEVMKLLTKDPLIDVTS